MDELEIPSHIVVLIRKITRECCFDFNQVAVKVNDLIQSSEGHLDCPRYFTVDECRKIFATDFSAANINKGSGDSHNVDMSVSKINLSDDSLTFDQLLEQQERRQEENDKKIEALFKRVMTSLESSDKLDILIDEEILEAQRKRQQDKELRKYERAKAAQRIEEQIILDKQRQTLKQRFDKDSIDAVGIDPLIGTESSCQDDDEEEITESHVQVVDYLLHNPEFDMILDAIEQDLESTAGGKNEGMSAELSEVLAILDAAAAESRKRPIELDSHFNVNSQSVMEGNATLPASGSKYQAIDTLVTTSDKITSVTVESQQKTKPVVSKQSQIQSSSATTPLEHPKASSGSNNLVSAERKFDSGYSRRGPRSKMTSETVSDDTIANDDDDDDDEDDDSDWRGTRDAMKKTAAIKDTESRKPEVWGAYGYEESTFFPNRNNSDTVLSELDIDDYPSSSEDETVENDIVVDVVSISINNIEESENIDSTEVVDDSQGLDELLTSRSDSLLEMAIESQCDFKIRDVDDIDSSTVIKSPDKSQIESNDIDPPSPQVRLDSADEPKSSGPGGILQSASQRRGNGGGAKKRGDRLIGSVENARQKRENREASSVSVTVENEFCNSEEKTLQNESDEHILSVDVSSPQKSSSNLTTETTIHTFKKEIENFFDLYKIEVFNEPYCPVVPLELSESLLEVISSSQSTAVSADEHNLVSLHGKNVTSKIWKDCRNICVLQCDLFTSQNNGSGGITFSPLSIAEKSDVLINALVSWTLVKMTELEGRVISVNLSCKDDFLSNEDKSNSNACKILHIAMEGVTPNSILFLTNYIQQAIRDLSVANLFQSLNLDTVQATFAPNEVNIQLSTFSRVLTNTESLVALERMALPPASCATGLDWQTKLNSNSTATCVLKPYVLEDPYLFSNVLFGCETYGLRLCGLRTAYVDPSNTAVNHYLHLESSLEVLQYVIDGSNNLLPVIVMCYYCAKACASDVLRQALGPEDPTLAHRTDPKSVRALYGQSRHKNIAFSFSSLLTNSWKDTMYWFGPRSNKCYSLSRGVCNNTLLSIPICRYVLFGVAVEYSNDVNHIMEHHNNLLSFIQKQIHSSLKYLTVDMLQLESVWSANYNEFLNYNLETTKSVISLEPAVYTIYQFATSCSDLSIKAIFDSLRNALALIQTKGIWNITVSLKIRDTNKRMELREDIYGSQSHLQLSSLKSMQNEDFNSHEDVGLQDVIVVSIAPQTLSIIESHSHLQNTIIASPLDFIMYILECIPSDCNTTIIGLSSNAGQDASSDKVYVCLRGYHIIENIDKSVSTAIDSICTRLTSASQGLTSPSKLNSLMHGSIKVIKGRRAFDVICREFRPTEHTFLKEYALLNCENFVPSHLLSIDGTSTTDYQRVMRSLFPPGVFNTLSVVIIPFVTSHNNDMQHTSILLRILKRLEKENFSIQKIASVKLDAEIRSMCTQDSLMDASLVYSPSVINQWENDVCDWFNSLSEQYVLAVVVKGNSALRSLRSIIGPINPECAIADYPTSIVATLASTASNSSKRGPGVFFTLTCKTTDLMLKKISQIGAEELSMLHPLALSLVDTNNREHNSLSDVDIDLAASKIITELRDNSKSEFQMEIGGKKKDIRLCEITPSESKSQFVAVSSVEITCLLITHDLMTLHGIGPVVQVIHKEGLKIVQAKSSYVHINVAKKLMELAGQSSLSMKPTLNMLLKGPVLIMALEGSSHSILRLKQVLQQPSSDLNAISSSHLNTLTSSKVASSSTALGKVADGTWGVLSSSSTRLARDLLLYCFDSLICSSYEIIQSNSPSEDIRSSSTTTSTTIIPSTSEAKVDFVNTKYDPNQDDDLCNEYKASLPPPPPQRSDKIKANQTPSRSQYKTPPQSPSHNWSNNHSPVFYTPPSSSKESKLSKEMTNQIYDVNNSSLKDQLDNVSNNDNLDELD